MLNEKAEFLKLDEKYLPDGVNITPEIKYQGKYERQILRGPSVPEPEDSIRFRKGENEMKRDKMLTELGNGVYSVVTWHDDPETYVDPHMDFSDERYTRVMRRGFKIGVISIDVFGSLNILSVSIYNNQTGEVIRPLPRSILLNRPVSEGHSIYLCFEPALDLRNVHPDTYVLHMSISNYKPGDKFYVSYGEQKLLKEVD